jgi:hypothetical protein
MFHASAGKIASRQIGDTKMSSEGKITTRDDGFIDIRHDNHSFVIFPERNGKRFMTAHNDEWASVPVGDFATLGDAINRAMQPFRFPDHAKLRAALADIKGSR